MTTLRMTEENFDTTISSNDVVLIDFWAQWCGPCRVFAPIFEKTSERFPDVVFAKVDTESEQALAATFQVMSIPTLVIIRGGVVLFSQAGALPEASLVELVEKTLQLDMDDVQRQLHAQQSSNA